MAEDSRGIISAGHSLPCRRPLGQSDALLWPRGIWFSITSLGSNPAFFPELPPPPPWLCVDYGTLSCLEQTNGIIACGLQAGKVMPGCASCNWPGREYQKAHRPGNQRVLSVNAGPSAFQLCVLRQTTSSLNLLSVGMSYIAESLPSMRGRYSAEHGAGHTVLGVGWVSGPPSFCH